jgi:FixJ family two-component response regulator
LPNRDVVFVVDDDPGMLTSMKRLLRQHGYDSVLFSSATAFGKEGDFDNALYVLLDINLGDGSGIELRHQLIDAGIAVPVIYMTGNENLPFAGRRLRLAASHFLPSHSPLTS